MESNERRERDELTRFLNEWAQGSQEAERQLVPRIQAELHAIAERHARGQRVGHTLQPTALVNEAYLRLFVPERVGWNDRKHFFAMAAQAMRQILVSHARSKNRVKRGGDQVRVEMDSRVLAGDEPDVDILDLDGVLNELQEADERQGRIVELRFFGGLEVQEVAEVMGLSKSTVEREWRAARAWLGLRLEGLGG